MSTNVLVGFGAASYGSITSRPSKSFKPSFRRMCAISILFVALLNCAFKLRASFNSFRTCIISVSRAISALDAGSASPSDIGNPSSSNRITDDSPSSK